MVTHVRYRQTFSNHPVAGAIWIPMFIPDTFKEAQWTTLEICVNRVNRFLFPMEGLVDQEAYKQ
jgi:hypothetical protein